MEDLPEIINCTNLTREQYMRLATVRTVSAGACFSVTLVIFAAVVFIRAFGTLLQRLFVCLTAITAWHQAMLIACIRPYVSTTAAMCTIFGFLNHWSGNLVVIFTFVVIVILLCKVCQEDVGRLSDCCQVSGRCKKILEFPLVLGLFGIPLLFVWIPFLHTNYGPVGGVPWCWIVTVKKDCSRNAEGFWEVMGLYYTPLGILVLLMILSTCVVICVFIKRAYSYRLTRRSHRRKAWETVLLLAILLLFCVLAGIEAASNLYTSFTKKKQSFTLYVVHAAITPVSKLLIPLGFLVYLYSLKKFKREAVVVAIGKWRQNLGISCHCSRFSTVHVDASQHATARSTYAIISRSDTHFSPPHTGGFTTVSSTTGLVSEQTETGCGSFTDN